MIRRLPSRPLRPFVSLLWASGGDDSDQVALLPSERELVLPTGAMHLVFRVSSDPLRLFDDDGAEAGIRAERTREDQLEHRHELIDVQRDHDDR